MKQSPVNSLSTVNCFSHWAEVIKLVSFQSLIWGNKLWCWRLCKISRKFYWANLRLRNYWKDSHLINISWYKVLNIFWSEFDHRLWKIEYNSNIIFDSLVGKCIYYHIRPQLTNSTQFFSASAEKLGPLVVL